VTSEILLALVHRASRFTFDHCTIERALGSDQDDVWCVRGALARGPRAVCGFRGLMRGSLAQCVAYAERFDGLDDVERAVELDDEYRNLRAHADKLCAGRWVALANATGEREIVVSEANARWAAAAAAAERRADAIRHEVRGTRIAEGLPRPEAGAQQRDDDNLAANAAAGWFR
jgi:hypothetical protein